MNKVMLSAVITLLIIEAVSFLINASSQRFDWAGFGLMQFICALFAIVPSLVLTLVRATREIGQGTLLAIGIALLIGLAVCSNATYKI